MSHVRATITAAGESSVAPISNPEMNRRRIGPGEQPGAQVGDAVEADDFADGFDELLTVGGGRIGGR
jgi:hypothetical protein